MAPEKDSETFLMKDTHARKRQRMQNERNKQNHPLARIQE